MTPLFTVLLDMDDTIVDFHGSFCERAQQAGIDLAGMPRLLWEVKDTPGYEQALTAVMDQFAEDPAFWSELRLLSSEIPAIVTSWQDAGAEVYILTACTGAAYAPKRDAVIRHLPMIGYKRMITAHHKWCVQGDVLIDDKPANLRHYAERWPQAKLASIEYPFHATEGVPPHTFLAPDYRDPVNAWRLLNRQVHEWILDAKITKAATGRDVTFTRQSVCHLCGAPDRFMCGHFVGGGAL